MTCVVQPCPTLSNLLPRLDNKNIIYFNLLQHPSNLVQPFRARAYARNLLEWRLRLNVVSDFFLVNLLKRLDKVGRLDSGMILKGKNPSNLLKGWTRLGGLKNLPKIWGDICKSALAIRKCYQSYAAPTTHLPFERYRERSASAMRYATPRQSGRL